ncbi:MAG: cation:proton antiporter, partial [Lachnospiraceae bacterium]|nr:cation:proton antiporter [Lachnospiraceae bacterium]
IHLPEVVGALIAGIIIGPSLIGIVSFEGDGGVFLEYAAEVGVVLLMYGAGLETDLTELKKNAVASFVVAAIGVIVPLGVGTGAYALFFHENINDHIELLKCIFVGVVLTATSVSITVQTLREMGKLKGAVGTTILGAAVIDDILGIIVLTIVSSMADSSVEISEVFIKIGIYAVVLVVLFFVVKLLENFLATRDGKRRASIFGMAFCFILAFGSEELFGIADITGAYFAGLMLCNSKISDYLDHRVETINNHFFSMIFFAGIGIKATFSGMSGQLWLFAVVLTIVAIISKLVGCGLGAKACKFNWKESMQIGVGMISRGEVALIVASKGQQVGLIDEHLFAPIVIMVIVTTLITPILLKIVFKDKDGNISKDGGDDKEPVENEVTF